jgi:hypothetical protein
VEFCKKKEENCIAPYCQSREVGDAYTYLAYKRETDFLICQAVGKWNETTCNIFYERLASRLRFPTRKRRLTIFSDGNKQNITGIQNSFPQGSVNYAIRKKIRENQKILGIVSQVIYGNVALDKISITHIDGFCSKLRERISCFTRKARSFAKRKIGLEDRLEIFSISHNFIEKKFGETPAMREGLQTKPLTWNTFFNIRLPILN